MEEQTAYLILIRAPALSGARLFELLQQFGSAATLLEGGVAAWRGQLSPATCDFLASARAELVDADRRWLDSDGHHLVTIGQDTYPELLKQLPDPPAGLFVSGDPALLNTPQLAVVGSRNPTPYGRQNAEAFARHLSGCGLTITSGLAAGIDAASHRGALQSADGLTVAVCGTGLDSVYPRSSESLAREIEQRGALVSEYPPGTPPRKHHFPQRNRLISGMSLGTIIVEATLGSGSLITAKLAADQGREVFAIPGSIHNPMAKGCHQLIRQGAKLVDSADDILCELGPLAATLRRARPGPLTKALDSTGISQDRLDKDYKILLDALGFEPMGVDQLVARSGFGADSVASMLLMLELDGRIESHPGGLYFRAGPPI